MINDYYSNEDIQNTFGEDAVWVICLEDQTRDESHLQPSFTTATREGAQTKAGELLDDHGPIEWVEDLDYGFIVGIGTDEVPQFIIKLACVPYEDL